MCIASGTRCRPGARTAFPAARAGVSSACTASPAAAAPEPVHERADPRGGLAADPGDEPGRDAHPGQRGRPAPRPGRRAVVRAGRPAPPARAPPGRTAPGRSPRPAPARCRPPRITGTAFAATWYSVTSGGGGGEISNTCRFCAVPSTGSPVRSCPQQPHAAGAHTTVSPGSGDCFSVEDCAPGCLPGLRPDLPRSDRSRGFFLYGLSDDGGLDDVEESLSRRRRSSSTCAASAVPRQLRGGQLIAGRGRLAQPRVERLQLRDPRTQPRHLIRCGHMRRIGHKPHSTTADGQLSRRHAEPAAPPATPAWQQQSHHSITQAE